MAPERGDSHLKIVDHPLAAHLLVSLRDRRTPATWFRAVTKRLTMVLMLEATKDLPSRPVSVLTPLEETS